MFEFLILQHDDVIGSVIAPDRTTASRIAAVDRSRGERVQSRASYEVYRSERRAASSGPKRSARDVIMTWVGQDVRFTTWDVARESRSTYLVAHVALTTAESRGEVAKIDEQRSATNRRQSVWGRPTVAPVHVRRTRRRAA
jgi:hypothetical protein